MSQSMDQTSVTDVSAGIGGGIGKSLLRADVDALDSASLFSFDGTKREGDKLALPALTASNGGGGQSTRPSPPLPERRAASQPGSPDVPERAVGGSGSGGLVSTIAKAVVFGTASTSVDPTT